MSLQNNFKTLLVGLKENADKILENNLTADEILEAYDKQLKYQNALQWLDNISKAIEEQKKKESKIVTL